MCSRLSLICAFACELEKIKIVGLKIGCIVLVPFAPMLAVSAGGSDSASVPVVCGASLTGVAEHVRRMGTNGIVEPTNRDSGLIAKVHGNAEKDAKSMFGGIPRGESDCIEWPIKYEGSSCKVSSRGGVVVSYVPAHGEEVIALGRRGGIPICWPWFVNAAPPNGPFWGLLRDLEWRKAGESESSLTIETSDTAQTRELWPYAFKARLTVSLSDGLSLKFEVENCGEGDMVCRDGVHAFFKTGESLKCVVRGLDGLNYFYGAEQSLGYSRKCCGDFQVCRMKRGYVFAGGNRNCALVDPTLRREMLISYRGNAKTIVWNGVENPLYADVGDGFVCVEGANYDLSDAYELHSGEVHSMSLTVKVVEDRVRWK